MRPLRLLLCLLAVLPGACVLKPRQPEPAPQQPAFPAFETFQAEAARRGLRLELPDWERTPEALRRSGDRVQAAALAELDRLAAQDPESVTFESTTAWLERIQEPVRDFLNRAWLLRETSPDPAVREAAAAQVERFETWILEQSYREDVYRIIAAYDAALRDGRRPALEGEDRRLHEELLRDYRRAGMALPEATRAELQDLRAELSRLGSRFDRNITEATGFLDLSAEELDGVPPDFLAATAREDGLHRVDLTVGNQRYTVLTHARSEAVRRRLLEAWFRLSMEENGPLLDRMIALRDRIARLLGYASWADYRTEVQMAGSAERALAFVEGFARDLEPRFRAELQVLASLKAEDTGDPEAQIEIWDFRYYTRELLERRYRVDTTALREFFPLPAVQEGMFRIYGDLFGLDFRRVQPPWVWAEGVELWVVLDRDSGAPLGAFYLDLYPRPGKYGHFAQFDLTQGRLGADGLEQRPVAALVCNFPKPEGERPSLLTWQDVGTYFHEFGHCLHAVLSRARWSHFAGGGVPQDFVEAPSQMFEAWAEDPAVLATYARHWRNPDRRLDPELIRRAAEADRATKATWYRRQLALALSDLRMHLGGEVRAAEVLARTFAEVFLPVPPGTNMAAHWGHLNGYDAGYYGYAWADVIAADLTQAFREAPGGLLDAATGRRLRREIYEPGGARPVEDSIRAFLGRAFRTDALLRSLGITPGD